MRSDDPRSTPPSRRVGPCWAVLLLIALVLPSGCATGRTGVAEIVREVGARFRPVDDTSAVLPPIRPLPLEGSDWEQVGSLNFDPDVFVIPRKGGVADELRAVLGELRDAEVVFIGRPEADALSRTHARAVASQRALAARRWAIARDAIRPSHSTAFSGTTAVSSGGGSVDIYVRRGGSEADKES